MRFSHVALLFLDFRETYWQRLSDEERRRRDRRIPRRALKPYSESPWFHKYNCADDQALLNMTGCDYAAFSGLLEEFKRYWNAFVMDKEGNIWHRKNNRGRHRMLDAEGGLRRRLQPKNLPYFSEATPKFEIPSGFMSPK